MTKTTVSEQVTHQWYARPVFFVADRPVPSEKSWWGYDVIKIVDPDGNELLFPASD